MSDFSYDEEPGSSSSAESVSLAGELVVPGTQHVVEPVIDGQAIDDHLVFAVCRQMSFIVVMTTTLVMLPGWRPPRAGVVQVGY